MKRTVTRNVTSRDVTGRNTPVTVTQEEGNVDADGKADGEGQSYLRSQLNSAIFALKLEDSNCLA